MIKIIEKDKCVALRKYGYKIVADVLECAKTPTKITHFGLVAKSLSSADLYDLIHYLVSIKLLEERETEIPYRRKLSESPKTYRKKLYNTGARGFLYLQKFKELEQLLQFNRLTSE